MHSTTKLAKSSFSAINFGDLEDSSREKKITFRDIPEAISPKDLKSKYLPVELPSYVLARIKFFM